MGSDYSFSSLISINNGFILIVHQHQCGRIIGIIFRSIDSVPDRVGGTEDILPNADDLVGFLQGAQIVSCGSRFGFGFGFGGGAFGGVGL